MSAVPDIVAAAAAAILTTKYLPDEQKDDFPDQRYFVHNHIAPIGENEPALIRYLEDIYDPNTRLSIAVSTPSSSDFHGLREAAQVVEATRRIAEQLRRNMESKNANPGILFGFLLAIEDEMPAYGVVKADLEDHERYFLDMTSSSQWTIESVTDILPPPQAKYAKFAISPRPRATGQIGIRDTQADPDTAANYFLSAIGVEIPRTSGTKLAVAQAAKRSGYDNQTIRHNLGNVVVDTPLERVMEDSFPDVSDQDRKRLEGPPERPMTIVLADDPFLTTWYTRETTFKLTVDENVEVDINGRVVTVTLPEDHEPIDLRYEK